MSKRQSYIQTYTGCQFKPYNPIPEHIYIEDIAHSLSQQCRFNGHTREFYSVAQHSVLVAEQCQPRAKMWGLLHDAAEAYVSDLATPIKSYMYPYVEMEDKIHAAVIERFLIPIDDEIHRDVKAADRNMLVEEARCLMNPDPAFEKIKRQLVLTGRPFNIVDFKTIGFLKPEEAEELFLSAYKAYSNEYQPQLQAC